jgi:hypothetical protein
MNKAGIKKVIKEEIQKSRYSILLESPETLDEKSILKNKYPFKAIYIFGPAGSGKSYIAGNLLGIPTDFTVSNPDDRIEEVFPAFGVSMKFANSGDGASADLEALQQNSRTILQNASRAHTSNLIGIANPITFDTTGEQVPKMVKRIEALTRLGYDIAVFMVNVPTQASVDRDARRERNVGVERTTNISQAYQRDVVQSKGYLKALGANKNVTVLSDVYNNIFDLGTGELLTKPTVITPDMLPNHLNPEKNPEAFAIEKAKMEQAVSNLQRWVNTPVENPAGQTVLKGMRTLVKKSGGKLGQNLNDLVIATAKEELQDPDIIAAAEHLSSLGGVAMITKKTKDGKAKMVKAPSADQPAVTGAVRGKKDTGDDSIRGMTQKESLNYDNLVDLVRDVLITNGDG